MGCGGPDSTLSLLQMQAEEEDGDFNVMFQLQHKELLQQLLALLSSSIVQRSHWDSRPCGLSKER